MVPMVVAVVALVTFPSFVMAQEARIYVGGTFNLVTQTHSDREPIGGTTHGGSALFGVTVSPHVAIEFEPSFGGRNSWEYTYRPSPSLLARVVASRRDTFFPVQARIRLGVLEPVLGVGFVYTRISRHATVAEGGTYFDDSRTEDNVALVGGVDAALQLVSSLYVVPTFRVLFLATGSPGTLTDPLGAQTSTGSWVFRYGVGARVGF